MSDTRRVKKAPRSEQFDQIWSGDEWGDIKAVGEALGRRDALAGRALSSIEITLPRVETPVDTEQSDSQEADTGTDTEGTTDVAMPTHEAREDAVEVPAISEFGEQGEVSERPTSTIEADQGDRVSYVSPERLISVLETERPLYADVYKTALRLFPQVESIRRINSFATTDDSYESSSGGIQDNLDGKIYPIITMGEKSPVLGFQKDRWIRRLGIDDQSDRQTLDELPDSFWQTYTFAHELGHAVQRDENFESIFGPIQMEFDASLALRDYRQYVNSDVETNADYIAMLLMSETEIGRVANLPAPSHPPHEWRQWVTVL